MSHLLDGLPNPRKPADSQAHTGIDKRLAQKLNTYGLEDPPARQKNVTPLGIVNSIVSPKATSSDTRSYHISDLVTVAFYFLLRSCKYTKCIGHRWTVQFRTLMDFVFFVGDFLLSGFTPIKNFCQANQIFITLDNQKNTIHGDTISRFHSESAVACPVKAVIKIFLRLRKQGCDTTPPISNG